MVFAEEGYCSFRKLEDNCRVNIRYMYLMNYEAPSYRTFCHFVKGFLKYSPQGYLLFNYERTLRQTQRGFAAYIY
ncbi:transposase [Dialister hominis]|uniref:transposase n=1 Tax=Dialister hominis TaxID=2582419 RepID=UPI0035203E74